MFNAILATLAVHLDVVEQLPTIVLEIEYIEDVHIISKRYGAALRGIVWSYIKKQYFSDSDKVTRYVNYRRDFVFLEKKYGRDSKEYKDCVEKHKNLVSYIESTYGSKIYQDVSKDNGDSEPDEGHGSGLDTSLNGSLLTP